MAESDPYRNALNTAITNYEKLLRQTENPAARLDLQAKIESAKKAMAEKPSLAGTMDAAKEAKKSDARGRVTQSMRFRSNNTPKLGPTSPAIPLGDQVADLKVLHTPQQRPADLARRPIGPGDVKPEVGGPTRPATNLNQVGEAAERLYTPKVGPASDIARRRAQEAALRGASRIMTPLAIAQDLQGLPANEGEEEYMASNPDKYPFATGTPAPTESTGADVPTGRNVPTADPMGDATAVLEARRAQQVAQAKSAPPQSFGDRTRELMRGGPGKPSLVTNEPVGATLRGSASPTPNPATTPQLKPSAGLMDRPQEAPAEEQEQAVELQPIVIERLKQMAKTNPDKLRQSHAALKQYRARMDAMERALTAALNNDQADMAAGMAPRL